MFKGPQQRQAAHCIAAVFMAVAAEKTIAILLEEIRAILITVSFWRSWLNSKKTNVRR